MSTWRFRHPDARPGASRVRKATHRQRWFVNAVRTPPTRFTSKGTVRERRGFEVHEGRPAHSREGGDSAPVGRGIPSGGSASEGGARKGIEDEGRPRGPIGPAARAVDTDKGRGGSGRTGQRPAAPHHRCRHHVNRRALPIHRDICSTAGQSPVYTGKPEILREPLKEPTGTVAGSSGAEPRRSLLGAIFDVRSRFHGGCGGDAATPPESPTSPWPRAIRSRSSLRDLGPGSAVPHPDRRSWNRRRRASNPRKPREGRPRGAGNGVVQVRTGSRSKASRPRLPEDGRAGTDAGNGARSEATRSRGTTARGQEGAGDCATAADRGSTPRGGMRSGEP